MSTITRDVTTASSPRHPAPSRFWQQRGVAPILTGLLGFGISVIGIGVPSVWYDEAATITSTTRSWSQLWLELGNVDAVHGLYYVGMHALFDLVGYSPISLRMPSAIAIGIAAALVVVLGRQLSGTRLGVIAGLVFVILPRVTWAGTEGRSYAMTALVAVALTVIFVAAQRSPRRRWWVAYSAVAVLGTMLFIYLALVVVAHGATVAWRLARRDRMGLFFARRWAVATAVAAVASIPLAIEVVSQSGQVDWIDPIGPETLTHVFRSQWFYTSWPFAVVAWALIVAGVLLHRRHRPVLDTVVPALVVPTLALVAVSLIDPLYQPRYLTMCLPFVALAMAVGISALRWRFGVTSALALLVLLAIPQIASQRIPEAKENSSWSQVAALIASERAADPDAVSAFIYGNVQRHPSATARVMAYSYPDAFADSIDTTLLTPAAETGQLWETRAPIADAAGRLLGADVAYLITSNARDLRGEVISALAPVGWRVVERWDFTAVHVLKFEPAP